MDILAFVLGATAGALGWFVYDIGKQAGRKEARKLARFGVDLEAWEFEEEPRRAAPAAAPAPPIARLVTGERS